VALASSYFSGAKAPLPKSFARCLLERVSFLPARTILNF